LARQAQEKLVQEKLKEKTCFQNKKRWLPHSRPL
jgi:hypothetical protein